MTSMSNDIPIKLNSVVKMIEQKKDNIIVSTDKKSYTCEHVISTLPTGVLQSGLVKFKPSLPSEKVTALHIFSFNLLE